MDFKLLGDRIREEREKLRMTQQQLADEINMSVSFLGHIERGGRKCSLETLVKIATALGTNIDYLLMDSLNPTYDNIENEISLYLRKMGNKERLYTLNMVKAFYDYLSM